MRAFPPDVRKKVAGNDIIIMIMIWLGNNVYPIHDVIPLVFLVGGRTKTQIKTKFLFFAFFFFFLI